MHINVKKAQEVLRGAQEEAQEGSRGQEELKRGSRAAPCGSRSQGSGRRLKEAQGCSRRPKKTKSGDFRRDILTFEEKVIQTPGFLDFGGQYT